MAKIEKDFAVKQADHASNISGLEPEKTVHTVHNDEALKVFANYTSNEEWTKVEEKKVQRKLDWRLMPFLCATYGLQYYDKVMFSQAVRYYNSSTVGNPC
jgi:hypothetical protein